MKDVIIVGGGIIGMLTTRFLHDAGLDVMLVEQGELGHESTWAGGGILSPLYPWRYSPAISTLSRYGQQRYPALCKAVQAETDIDPQWIRSGLVFTDDRELPAAQAWAQTFGYDLQHLATSAALHECEPQLADIFQSGMFLPEVAQMRNPRIAHAMRTSLRMLPITLAEFTRVTGLESSDGRIVGVRVGDEVFKARKVVVTSGAWTGLFPEMQAVNINVRPVLGQMILFRGPKGLLKRIVLHEGRYLIPRKDGRILCGSTLEMNSFDKHTTDEARETLREIACNVMPALRDLPIQNHWSGLRPGSPDGVPYVGEHPDIAGLYVNAGHYRYGVTMGLASVQMLTDMMLGKAPEIDPTPYRLDAVRTPTVEWV
ncbi:MAG: FAD-dependent oxidoreductase [Thiothrix sp.]|uniref:NAD(P)/FAD-dependent oxidoreductase n=1 Tax=Thiothrix sp. TaxID=1032 RepID=UPI00261D3933|nr:FAD-dependent oxidoreductase [Thiothrix sp.]MDD5391595.1 FAD-dependent oxidoreductase [Thiothrix sp.]